MFKALLKKGIALTNVGVGYCMAEGKMESWDENLPCIGTSNCNPFSCPNGVASGEHKGAWNAIRIDAISNKQIARKNNDQYLLKKATRLENISIEVVALIEQKGISNESI